MYTLYTQGAIEKRRRRRRRRRTEREEADGPERRPRVPVAGPLKKKGGRQAGRQKKKKQGPRDRDTSLSVLDSATPEGNERMTKEKGRERERERRIFFYFLFPLYFCFASFYFGRPLFFFYQHSVPLRLLFFPSTILKTTRKKFVFPVAGFLTD